MFCTPLHIAHMKHVSVSTLLPRRKDVSYLSAGNSFFACYFHPLAEARRLMPRCYRGLDARVFLTTPLLFFSLKKGGVSAAMPCLYPIRQDGYAGGS